MDRPAMFLQMQLAFVDRLGETFDEGCAVASAVAQSDQNANEGIGLKHFEAVRTDSKTLRCLPASKRECAGLLFFAFG